MKKLSIITAASLVFVTCFAQFEKGDIKVGGAFCIQTDGSKTTNGTTVKGPKDFGFQLMPQVDYFIGNNTSIGGFIDIDLLSTTTFIDVNGDEVKLKEKDNFIGVGPALYHYRFIGEKQWFAIYGFAGLAFGTGGGKEESYDFINDEVVSTDKNRSMEIYVGAAPGMIFMPQDWFFFDIRFDGFGLWYNYEVEKEEGTETKHKSSYFKLGGNLNELFFSNTKVGVSFVF